MSLRFKVSNGRLPARLGAQITKNTNVMRSLSQGDIEVLKFDFEKGGGEASSQEMQSLSSEH